MKDRVIAITVTYNRTVTLKKTIEALLNQSYPVYKIIVVDNNSNEAEKIILKGIEKKLNNIEIVWLDENWGGAGGFEKGMLHVKNNHTTDWYWIMDDDAYPTKKCLENLLKYKKMPNVGCLTPLIYGIDLNKFQLTHHKRLSFLLTKDKPITDNVTNLRETEIVEANAFVGPLFTSKVVDELGVADGGLFIYGDDLEYTYRVSRKYKIYLVKDAVINHQDPPMTGKVTTPQTWWKEYYTIRNRYLFIQKYQKSFLLRAISISVMSIDVIKKIMGALVRKDYKGYRRLRANVIYKAAIDGLNGLSGKSIEPFEFVSSVINGEWRNKR